MGFLRATGKSVNSIESLCPPLPPLVGEGWDGGGSGGGIISIGEKRIRSNVFL